MVRVRRNKRKLLTALSPLLIFLALAGFALFMWTANVVLVRNSSGMTLENFTLTVCEKDYTLANILDGETGKLNFAVTGDSNFQMRVTLQDGTILTSSFGYVTGGAGAYRNRVTITVRPNLIEGTQQ